ncbi:glycosyltransferase [Luteococcus sp. H138]|uniref:glycosyltransferase n=1 Tax=unclassified Luteococcus TaxID=2639923 RepID=UPI00313DF54E
MSDAPHNRPRMIFHAPYPLNRMATSASGIRPVRMRDAFESLGYEVWEVTGTSGQRVEAAAKVRRALADGLHFDFCYSESSTMPTLLTDPDHLPHHPLVDFALLRTLRAHGTRVGLFYRDIYWRFPNYGVGLNPVKKYSALAAYRHDLLAYRRATDVLFLPSREMAAHVGDPRLTYSPLPPGHDVPEPTEVSPEPLRMLYVGGIGAHYRLHALTQAMADVPEAHLVLCCREADWAAIRDEYEPLPPNVEVVHRSGEELKELYQRTNVAVVYAEPVEYWDFAAPVKVYEYLGNGKPMIASEGSLTGRFVAENRLGWSLPYSREAATELLRHLVASPDEVHRAHQDVMGAREGHTWLERARTVVRELTGAEPGDRRADGPRSVLLVSAANSIHTARWANALVDRGLEVHLASTHDPADQSYDDRVTLHRLPNPRGTGYVAAAPAVRTLVQRLRPDLVNTHYASGYGTLSRIALTGLSVPHLLSVWGSDVYEFPDRNPALAKLLRGNLAAATRVASTSRAMAERTRHFTDKQISVTPFGIDTERFTPAAQRPARDEGGRDEVVVGTVKLLKPVYGIDTLIRTFVRAREIVAAAGGPALRLQITGGGPAEADLRRLADELGLPDALTGKAPHEQVPDRLRELDIYVALSRQESFGAAILEAGACGLPVVVSDTEGPAEVTIDGQTGIIIGVDDVEQAAQAIARLALDPALRARMGAAGRTHVEDTYSWSASVDAMLDAYRLTVGEAR